MPDSEQEAGAAWQGTDPRRAWLLALGAPAVLVCVALLQLYLTHNHQLSPWKGGGFGMFASVDRVEHRVVRAAFDGLESRPIDVEAFAALSYPDQQLVDRAKSMPTATALARLSARMDDVPWAETSAGVLTPADGSSDDQVDLSAEDYPGLTVSVWRVRYDDAANVATPQQLRTYAAERRP